MNGYIVKGIGGFYYVRTEAGIIECKPRGIFRKQKITPVAGDEVTVETENGASVIAEIAPRKNVFVRPPVANLDVLFLVASTTQPTPSTLVLDKLSAIAVDKGVQPVIVCTKADLGEADLKGANLREADFRGANLGEADLRGANLREADLRETTLGWANLRKANLGWANLSEADLRGADLRGANLGGANLRGTNLGGARLSEANLDFSVFPLWCGALSVQADERIVRQLIYHTLRLAQNAKMDCALKAALFTKELIAQANLFHRVESGDVERITDESLAYHTRKPGAAEEPEPLEKKD